MCYRELYCSGILFEEFTAQSILQLRILKTDLNQAQDQKAFVLAKLHFPSDLSSIFAYSEHCALLISLQDASVTTVCRYTQRRTSHSLVLRIISWIMDYYTTDSETVFVSQKAMSDLIRLGIPTQYSAISTTYWEGLPGAEG